MSTFTVEIERRKVFACTGPTKSQTINICTGTNKRGAYELSIRVPIELQVGKAEIAKHASMNDLINWLVQERKGSKVIRLSTAKVDIEIVHEHPTVEVDPIVGVEVLQPLPKPIAVKPEPSDEPWISEACRIAESCIDDLVKEFLKFPYLHRVEHSWHARLYEMLRCHKHLQGTFPLCDETAKSQLVHKEWPEVKARPMKNNRRGNFDIVILYPGQMSRCTPANFSTGLLEPPIAIEMGLNYGVSHLRGDAEKLLNSKIQHAYLVHLVRDQHQTDDIQTFLKKEISNYPRVKVAFAQVCDTEKHVKLLSAEDIEMLEAA